MSKWEFVSKCLTHFNNTEKIDEYKHKGISEAYYLYFVQNGMSEFQAIILALESDAYTVLEIDSVIRNLMGHPKNTMHDIFYASKK